MAKANNPQPAPPSSAPAKQTSAKKVVLIVVVIILVLGLLSSLGGYLIYRSVKKATNDAGIEDINQVVKDLEEYPEAYQEAGLPQYPNAEVASLSGKDATVEVGVSIVLTSTDPHQKVVDYFDQQLKASGWTTGEATSPLDDSFFFRSYTKGDQEYALTVQSSEASETTATIFWGKSATSE